MNNPSPDIPAHRILIVDDNPAIHEDFGKILNPAASQRDASLSAVEAELFGDAQPVLPRVNFKMDSAFQGQEALAKVQAAEAEGCPYALAFVDVRMPPGWDGVETIARIWKEHPAIQVVICTAYSDYSWDEILGKLGETDSLVILKKPFDNVEVLQLAHTLTRKWAVTRQAKAQMDNLDEMVRQRTFELLKANHDLESEIQRRTLIEAALRESEERFHKAFEAVSIGLAIQHADQRAFLDVNPCFAQVSGYAKEALIGKTPAELNFFAAPEQERQITQALAAGKQVHNLEVALRRPDGQVRQTLAAIEPLTLGDQHCLLWALLDVTEQRRLEDQLRQSQKMEAVGQLAAGVAHDFNNLLTIIQGHTSIQLAKQNLDQSVARALEQVQAASEQAAALTRQLLAFSRKQVIQRRPFSLAGTLTRTQGLLARAVGETIQIECQSAPDLPPIIGDESNLEQVIMNLVVNARDAMPQGGRVRLLAEPVRVDGGAARRHRDARTGDYVRLTVADGGCGMDAETLSHIFEPFFTTKPVGKGTGIGLATVYGIIKRHEGWIEVESTPGRGTSFHVFLPTSSESPVASIRPLPVPVTSFQARHPGETILVVEDEPQVRACIVSLLTHHGYDVEQSASGVEALGAWDTLRKKIKLLLTDMVMPNGISGGLLAQRLQRRDPELKVVYMSGYSPESMVNGAELTEGVNFLSKPFTKEELLTIVRRALDATPAQPQRPATTAG